MIKGFWATLNRPIVGLAPMDGVTDAPMRFMTAKYGKSDVTFTEFVSAEALASVVDGRIKKPMAILNNLKYDEIERPIIAQLFGKDPMSFYVAAKRIVELGFDGVDINMGCPAKKVSGRGEGAGLIKNPELAAEIISAVKRGVDGKIPVSVKTRIGYDKIDTEWWKFLAEMDLAAVTMHGRTFRQMYQGLADWESLAKAATLIKQSGTIFLGNGDVDSRQMAEFRVREYGVDGVLIGRAAMGNPWVFQRSEIRDQSTDVIKDERLRVALEHARKYEELLPDGRFLNMRKHLTWYARGFDGAVDLRQKLVLTNSADEVEKILTAV